MPRSVTVEGSDAAQRHLRAIGERAQHQRATFEKASKDAQRQISGVPVATGRLARSVHGGAEGFRTATDHGYTIGTTVPYSRFVFRGTSTMAAQPPKVPPDLGRRAAVAVAADLRHA